MLCPLMNLQMHEEQMEQQLQREEAERLREQRARISQREAAADNWALQVKAALLIQVGLGTSWRMRVKQTGGSMWIPWCACVVRCFYLRYPADPDRRLIGLYLGRVKIPAEAWISFRCPADSYVI